MSTEPSKEVMAWADSAMFEMEDISHLWDEERGIVPKVTVMWMTPDPLGAAASFIKTYKGQPVRSLADITDEERRSGLEDMKKTALQAPLEDIKIHFFVEGGDRAWEQQLTRQRTAVYAAESLRFAVIQDLVHSVSLPPTVFGTKQNVKTANWPRLEMPDQNQQQRWRDALDAHARVTTDIYSYLVNDGMPAEDARGILGMNTATRVNYTTDLRNLLNHAGLRLCTQAQFMWRHIFHEFAEAIRAFRLDPSVLGYNEWQFDAIADSGLFAPICYQTGECQFGADFDRHCSIRDRVQAYARQGIKSDKWEEGFEYTAIGAKKPYTIDPINPAEWKAVHFSARTKEKK